MKTLITLLFLIPALSFSQLKLDPQTKSFHNEKIIELDSMSKDQIYSKTKVWFAETFKSSEAVITSDLKEEGLITGRYVDNYYLSSGLYYDFNNLIKVYIKDNKVKVVISGIEAKGYTLESYMIKPDGTYPRKMYQKMFEDIDTKTTATISGLETFLKKKINNDW